MDVNNTFCFEKIYFKESFGFQFLESNWLKSSVGVNAFFKHKKNFSNGDTKYTFLSKLTSEM